MIFAIHQPNYIPFAGYFYKILKSEVFVMLDTVQYPRGQSFSPRNRIKTPQGAIFLTIPVSIPGGKQGKVLYTEVETAGIDWKAKHIRTLEMNYKKAPYFNEVFSIYSETLLGEKKNIAELNQSLIELFCNYMGIRTKIIKLSELLNDFGNKTELITDIGKKLGADSYLSGTGGGKDYNDEQLMKQHGIRLVYSDFVHPVYKQLWGDFIPNLSVIDLLFNCGKDSLGIIEGARSVN